MIGKRVKDVICRKMEYAGIEPYEIMDDSILKEDLSVDSLDMVEIVMALEEEFLIDIPDEAVEKFKTVRDIVEYITEHEGGKQ